jgi:hypothetical protein
MPLASLVSNVHRRRCGRLRDILDTEPHSDHWTSNVLFDSLPPRISGLGRPLEQLQPDVAQFGLGGRHELGRDTDPAAGSTARAAAA